MSRRRTRSRATRRRWLLGLLLVTGAAVYGGFSASAFSTGDVDRTAAADVTTDDSGACSIDAATAVHANSTERLVAVTNHLGRPVSVTVTLRDDSTHIGELVVDGSHTGDTASFDLSMGETQSVDIDVPDDDSLVGEEAFFHVEATDSGLDVAATDRSVPVEA